MKALSSEWPADSSAFDERSPEHPSVRSGRPAIPRAKLPTLGSEELWNRKIRVTGEVERGGMSYVVRGTDTTLRRELALKVSPLPRDQLPRAQLARFIEEAQITAQLEHPNVVPVHEIGMDPEGRVYFSMKLVRGQSLETILEKRRQKDPETLAEFGLRRLLDVFLQVCQALEYAHARGVIHRDLKPSNIMVGDFGEVLVMDWGVAKVVGRPDAAAAVVSTTSGSLWEAEERLRASDPSISIPPHDISSVRAGKKSLATQAGTVIGTPAYMSPEQAQGAPVDERTDMYSLGVILYEILCDHLPFEDDDATRLLVRVLTETAPRPSVHNPRAPLALEMLALRLLEKEPERRTLTIAQIRTHVQNYIEGIGRDYGREQWWSNALWAAGALGLFAFLVWYLTGQSIAVLFVLAPPTVFNAVGWFLLILALRCPLWSGYLAIRPREERDRFRPATGEETFVSGYLAHRTFAAALAPLFQLAFIIEVASVALTQAAREPGYSTEFVQRITTELRTEWAHSLIVILIFLFAYLFLLSAEVRFARAIDRYDLLVARPAWEAVWPFFLIVVLLLTIGATNVIEWALGEERSSLLTFLRKQALTQPLDLIDIVKTLVFQGTFLMGLVFSALLLAFPVAEVLAALRLSYQPADEATVRNRVQYFMRSMAIFRVARVNWLYGGAMIGGLTAMTILAERPAAPLVKQVLYILGPSLIGFAGYWLTRRQVSAFLAQSPAVERLLQQQMVTSRIEHANVSIAQLEAAPWRRRLLQLVVPLGCIALYLVWTGSGLHELAIRQLILPVTPKGWLLIFPYALLLLLLLVRDNAQIWVLKRFLAKQNSAPAGAVPSEAQSEGPSQTEPAVADVEGSAGVVPRT
ncbi:MAG TPA: serine/threonine-protein kinase [Polyangiaceae bacterium]